jgi:GDSL-like Lipase/Acylhydrolase family
MTRRKKLIFAIAAAAIAVIVTTTALLIIDIYLHGRFERSAGYNVWGYRGPRVGAKQPGGLRIAMLGGSTAYGYGVLWDEAIPAQLERALTAAGRPISVVNLGYNNEGAYSLRFTIEDYLWLDYDLAILYEGYNDVQYTAPDFNRQVYRRDSPVFRLTGYLPIFPIIFKEKAGSLLSGGAVGAGNDESQKTVFRPGLAARGAAGILNTLSDVSTAIGHQATEVASPEHLNAHAREASGCERPWTLYCESMAAAIEFARSHGIAVLVVGQPELAVSSSGHARHAHQQQQLAAMIARRFANDSRVQYVSMRGVVDTADASKSFDRMHLNADGNRLVAERLAVVVREFLPRLAK